MVILHFHLVRKIAVKEQETGGRILILAYRRGLQVAQANNKESLPLLCKRLPVVEVVLSVDRGDCSGRLIFVLDKGASGRIGKGMNSAIASFVGHLQIIFRLFASGVRPIVSYGVLDRQWNKEFDR